VSNTPDNNRLEQRPGDASALQVEIIVDSHLKLPVDRQRVVAAVREAAQSQGFHRGSVGVRVCDDQTIHELNRKHIGHDYPTDVISFGYQQQQHYLEGELVVSLDTASQRAGELGWPVASELLLYVVHGVLHIAGMDDLQPHDRRQMRKAEQQVLGRLGIADAASFDADRPVAAATGRRGEESP
jgi:probable rRNA maturation factor